MNTLNQTNVTDSSFILETEFIKPKKTAQISATNSFNSNYNTKPKKFKSFLKSGKGNVGNKNNAEPLVKSHEDKLIQNTFNELFFVLDNAHSNTSNLNPMNKTMRY